MSFKSGLRSLMAAVAATTFGFFGKKFNDNRVSESEIPEPDRIPRRTYRDVILARGAKEFTIDGVTVIARNERNAIRKVNNIKNGVTS